MGIEERVEKVLRKLKLNPFFPFPFARSGFWQTIYGNYWPILKPSKPDTYHHVVLPDGDILVLAENRPPDWIPGQRIALLVHGLTGSYQSTYMQRMCRRLNEQGILVLRLNLRFCGPGRGLARRPYHAGVSDDTRAILEWIKTHWPDSPVTQIGFSLGGNVTLKMAGEDGSRPSGNLDSVIAVSPPIDLEASSLLMSRPENKLFERIFVNAIMNDFKLMKDLYPDELADVRLPEAPSMQKLEEVFATHRAGFKSAKDYYNQCSSIHFIPEIKIPTLVVCSADDPVIDGLAIGRVPHSSNLDVLLTQRGGHVGFLGFGTRYDEVRWSDQALTNWLSSTVA